MWESNAVWLECPLQVAGRQARLGSSATPLSWSAQDEGASDPGDNHISRQLINLYA
jgi:hypothetical protein